MCLSFLAATHFKFTFLGEYIFLEQEQAQLEFREVFDVFFRTICDWPDARILCISPHDLIEAGSLKVTAIEAPGAGGHDDRIAYSVGSGHQASFNYITPSFSINVLGSIDPFTPLIESYSGEVLQPRPRVPPLLANNPLILEVMSKAGTLFEIALGNLLADHDYAFRIQVKPHAMLGLSDKQCLKNSMPENPGQVLIQDLNIVCPKTCRFNFEGLISKIQDDPDYANAAATIQTFLRSPGLRLFESARHRILLVSAPGASIERESPPGCIWWVGTYPLMGQDHRRVSEWAGGTRTYWTDHAEFLARTIWNYLEKWAAAEPKTKESITSALGGLHSNCSLIVDALTSAGAVQLVDVQRGTYKAVGTTPPEKAFLAVAADPSVNRDFGWMGYEIRYSVRYEYLSEKDSKRKVWIELRNRWAFRIAVTSLLLTLLGILISLWK